MAHYDVVQNFSFVVDKIKNKTYKKDGDLYIDRVVLKTDNHQIPKGKVTVNPSVSETEVEKVKQDGTVYHNETEKSRDPTILELDAKFPKIQVLTSAVNTKGSVKLKGMVRTVRDSEEDEWNFFIKTSELDKLKAEFQEDEETAEKVSEDSEDSTAEDFVDDQTNIDFGDEHNDEETEESIVFSGEDEERAEELRET